MNASADSHNARSGDCDSESSLSLDQARRHLLEYASSIMEIEIVDTASALGRVLAEDQHSFINVPGADNSAVDGYAVASQDVAAEGETRLPVSQHVVAGKSGQALAPGTAARLFTAAWLPAGADAVVMQEHCRGEPDSVIVVSGPVSSGENVRRVGEDVASGTKILVKGTRLRPQDLGLAASVGLARLPVYRRLRVALIRTGSELAEPGAALQPGQIYDSNFFTLAGLLQALGCEWFDAGRVDDDPAVTRAVLTRAAESADLVLATGGVSVGEENHVKAAVRDLGHLDLWRVAVKPGKPFAFGYVGAVPFMGLPGNPVSAFVTFCLLVRPYILASQGARIVEPQSFPVVAGFTWSGTPTRCEYLRARLVWPLGDMVADIYPEQDSAVLTSAVWADGFVEVPEGRSISPGQFVRFTPFSELLS
jgi:molybdopterin molybdotransferase